MNHEKTKNNESFKTIIILNTIFCKEQLLLFIKNPNS